MFCVVLHHNFIEDFLEMFYIHLTYMFKYYIQFLYVKHLAYSFYSEIILILFAICCFAHYKSYVFLSKHTLFIFTSINLYKKFGKKVIFRRDLFVFL